jgi:hypothetical protein
MTAMKILKLTKWFHLSYYYFLFHHNLKLQIVEWGVLWQRFLTKGNLQNSWNMPDTNIKFTMLLVYKTVTYSIEYIQLKKIKFV